MLNFQKSLKRFRRDRRDDLSIVTGLPSSSLKRRSIFCDQSKSKRVRIETDIKLRKQFLEARAEAHEMTSYFKTVKQQNAIGSTLTKLSDLQIDSARKDLNNNMSTKLCHRQNRNNEDEKDNSSKYFDPETPLPSSMSTTARSRSSSLFGPAGETTIKHVPALVTATDCRNARESQPAMQGILKASSAANFQTPKKRRASEAEYWSSFRDRQIEESKSTGRAPCSSYVVGSRIRAPARRGWSACSSGIITKECVSHNSQVINSFVAGSTVPSVTGQYQPGSLEEPNIFSTPVVPSMSLLKSIKPPGSATAFEDTFFNGGQSTVMISEWMSRENMKKTTPAPSPIITKKYSVAQLMDIVCGYSVPAEPDLAGIFKQPANEPPENIFDFSANFQNHNNNPFSISDQHNQNVSVSRGNVRDPPCSPILTFPEFMQREPENPSTNQPFFLQNETSDSFGSSQETFGFLNSTARSNGPSDFTSILNEEISDEKESTNFFDIGPVNTTPTSKKSVTFLTDSEDNIRVFEHVFDIFNSSGSTASGTTPPKVSKRFNSSSTGPSASFGIPRTPRKTFTPSSLLNTPVLPSMPSFFEDNKENQNDFFSFNTPQLKLNLFSTYD